MVKEKQINTLSVIRVKNFHSQVKISNENNQKDPLNSKYNYTKVLVENPYNNRDIIAKVAKKQKGVRNFHTSSICGLVKNKKNFKLNFNQQ